MKPKLLGSDRGFLVVLADRNDPRDRLDDIFQKVAAEGVVRLHERVDAVPEQTVHHQIVNPTARALEQIVAYLALLQIEVHAGGVVVRTSVIFVWRPAVEAPQAAVVHPLLYLGLVITGDLHLAADAVPTDTGDDRDVAAVRLVDEFA